MQVLYDLVESFRSSAEVEDFVAQNAKDGLELVSQRPNPYLHHTSALYDTFLETLVLHLPDLKGGHVAWLVCQVWRLQSRALAMCPKLCFALPMISFFVCIV